MTPEEKRKKANEILDDTMTVSQAKKRKLDLRAKDLQIRAGSLKRKKDNDAAAKARRAKTAADKEQSAKEKRSAAKVSDVVAGIKKRKEKKAAAEKGKADKLKGIAAKRKAGVDKSLSRAKDVAKKGRVKPTIQKDEGELSAELKVAKGAAKGVIAGARAGVNVAKAAAKGIGAGIAGAKSKRAQGKVDAKERKIEKRNDKLEKAQDKKVKDRLNRRRMSKLKKMNPFQKKNEMKEELILLEIEKMEKKTDKVIDIMRGKNKIEISPKISEEVTGGISIQDAADYTPLEIETVDIITPKKLNHCDWRNEMFDLEGEEEIEEVFGSLVSGLKGAVKSGATALAKNPTVQKGVSAVRDVKRSLLPDVANSNSPLVRSGAQSRQSASNLFGPPKTTSATSSGGAALKSKPFKGPGGDPSGSGSGQAQQGTSPAIRARQTAKNQADRTRLSQRPDKFFGTQTSPKSTPTKPATPPSSTVASQQPSTSRPVSPPKNQGTGERSAPANDARQQAAKLANRNKTSSSTPPSRTTSTLASKSAPSKPAAPARDRMAGASKADRMNAWAKANPKLAAAKAKRDATRGTSSTTNPMLQDRKKNMPAAAVGAVGSAATRNEEVEQLDEILGTALKMTGKAIAKTGAKQAAKKKVVRAGIKAGGKRGGRAAQAGLEAGSRQKLKAKETLKDKSRGTGEKVGAIVGDVAGSLAGGGLGIATGPGALATGLAGGVAGEKVGGKIGKQLDKLGSKFRAKRAAKKSVKEEASDAMKDRQLERGGMGARRAPKKPISNTPNTFGKKKPAADGPSAMDIVKAKIRAQYGDKAIIDTKKEHYDWRSEMGIVEEEGKKDACYKKVKASAKVWPSAYASGRLVQCRKKGAANYGNSKSK